MRTERYATDGHVRLRVENVAGAVSVVTTDNPVTEIEVSSERADSALVEGTRVSLQRSGEVHEVHVIVPKPNKTSLFRREEVKIAVLLPHGADLDIETVSADVEAAGRYGVARVKTVSGDATIDVADDVYMQSVSGDVSVGEVVDGLEVHTVSGDSIGGRVGGASRVTSTSGDVRLGALERRAEVESVSGDLHVDVVNDGISLSTVSGDLRVKCATGGEVRSKTVSGDLTVGIAPGHPIRVDVHSKSGDVSSEIPLNDSPTGASGEVASAVTVVAESLSGDIKIVAA
jgi:DUF4097 and DUF4098 domain-containing protein YvlB